MVQKQAVPNEADDSYAFPTGEGDSSFEKTTKVTRLW